jgi:hypothetical protein
VAASLADVLLIIGEPAAALAQADKTLAHARVTGSAKYIARAQGLVGQVALAEGAPERAAAALAEGVRVARAIEYPALTWQLAHVLARACAAGGKRDDAVEAARLAAATLEAVAARAPEPALRRSFLEWRLVHAAREDIERMLGA